MIVLLTELMKSGKGIGLRSEIMRSIDMLSSRYIVVSNWKC